MMQWGLHRRNFLIVMAVISLGVLGSLADASEGVGQLFQFTSSAITAFDNSIEVRDARRVQVDTSMLAEKPDSFELQLLDRSQVRAIATEVELRPDGNMAWHGRIDPGEGRITLTLKDRVVIARIETTDGLYGLTTLPDGDQVLIWYQQDQFPEEADAIEPEPSEAMVQPMDAPVAVDSADRIDVMVLYTPQARSAAGGVSQIEAAIQNAVDSANTAFADSDVLTRFNLVHSAQANRNDTGNISSDLSWLRNDPTVASLRDTHAADLVSLIVENGGIYCGVAYVMRNPDPSFEEWGFQVTARFCIPNLTWAHEHGHNMGMEHDPANGAPPYAASYPWSFAHFVDGEFRTVMSYSNQCYFGCPRVGRFSNPAINFNGFPTGIANQRDNHRTANLTADIIANFRQSGPTCIIDLNLDINNQILSTTQTFEACDTITAGPAVTITPTGNITFQAGDRVVLRNGFSVTSGGRVRVLIDPLTGT
jgi:hypothetical protein